MNKKEIKERNSSLELLRILSMILIVFHHYYVHGNYSITSVDDFGFARIYLLSISSFGKIACGNFALITGFFMVEKKQDIKFYIKKSLFLASEMLFYSLLSLVLSSLVNYKTISIGDIEASFIPFFRGNWYVCAYIFFILWIPYINSFIDSIDKKIFKEILCLIFVTWILLSSIFGKVIDVGDIDFMFFMYLFGAYVKKYKKTNSEFNKNYLFISVFCAILLIILIVLLNYLGIRTNIQFFTEKEQLFSQFNFILSFAISYFLFLHFCHKEYVNKTINIISSTMLGVYLFSDNNMMSQIIWQYFSPNNMYANNPYIHSIIKVLCVMIVGIIIDLIRQNTIEVFIKEIIDKYYDKLFDKCYTIYINMKNLIIKMIEGRE